MCLIWWNVHSHALPVPFFKLEHLSHSVVKSSLYILDANSSSDMPCIYFIIVCDLSFQFLNSAFWREKVWFWWSLDYHSLMSHAFCVLSKKPFASTRSQTCSVFSFVSVIIWTLIHRSVRCFELIVMNGFRSRSKISFSFYIQSQLL